MNLPIVFTHYGNSPYLQWTLACARFTNPDADIVLIGDDANREVALSSGIGHVRFAELRRSHQREAFDRSFKPVCGAMHENYRNGGLWLRYVFERWFYVHEFAAANSIERFWHFDSDTMLLTRLADWAGVFAIYDCTEQCNGMCLNGYVTSRALSSYLEVIVDLFNDEPYLDGQRLEFSTIHPEYAFTEMRAYAEAKNRLGWSTFHLSKEVEGKCFDDCICQDHGFEMAALPSGQTVKNVFWEGGFFCFRAEDHRRVQFNSLNLSWVPRNVFMWVFDRATQRVRNHHRREYLARSLTPIGVV